MYYTLAYQVNAYCRACNQYSTMPRLVYQDAGHTSWMRFCATPGCASVWSSFHAPIDFPGPVEHYRALCKLME
jgi:hypothetical protein